MKDMLIKVGTGLFNQWIVKDDVLKLGVSDWGTALEKQWKEHPILGSMIGGGVGFTIGAGVPAINKKLGKLGQPQIPLKLPINFGFSITLWGRPITIDVSGSVKIRDEIHKLEDLAPNFTATVTF